MLRILQFRRTIARQVHCENERGHGQVAGSVPVVRFEVLVTQFVDLWHIQTPTLHTCYSNLPQYSFTIVSLPFTLARGKGLA